MLLAARFCCCLSLETGIIVWGYLGTGLSLIFLVVNIVLLVKYDPEANTLPEDYGMFDHFSKNSPIERQTGFAIMIAICMLGIITNYMVVMAVQRVSLLYICISVDAVIISI